MPLEEVIRQNIGDLFPGMEVLDHAAFRVTRDADFEVSDEADDLLEAVEVELRRRRMGEVVRVELESGAHQELREQLVDALGVEESEVFELDGLLDLADLMEVYSTPGSPRPARRALPQRDPGAVRRRPRRARRHVRRDPQARRARPPPLRVVLALGRALRRAGRGRSRRARDQADRVPHERRVDPRPAAHRGDRARQAGGLPRRAQGALRRAGEHRLGPPPRGGRRPRDLRRARAEDPRQVDPRDPPRGRRGAPLRPRRDGQLQPEDRAPLHRPRPVHLRRGHRRRRRRHVQPAHRLRAPRAEPQGPARPARAARRDHRADRARDRARARPARTSGS